MTSYQYPSVSLCVPSISSLMPPYQSSEEPFFIHCGHALLKGSFIFLKHFCSREVNGRATSTYEYSVEYSYISFVWRDTESEFVYFKLEIMTQLGQHRSNKHSKETPRILSSIQLRSQDRQIGEACVLNSSPSS